MNIKEIIFKIRKLIGDDKLDNAFEIFESIAREGSNVQNVLIQLKGRHSFLQRSVNQNTISFYEANLELCKIRVSLLDLIKELPIENNKEIEINQTNIIPKEKEETLEIEVFDEDEDYGYLDYLIDYQENSEEIQNSFQNMASHTKGLTENMTKRTKQLNNLKKNNQTPNLVISRKIANALANEMMEFVLRMETEISVFDRASKESLKNAFQVLQILYGEGGINFKELEKLDSSLDILITGIENMRNSSVSAKVGFADWKKVTKEINRAKRRTEDVLDQLYDELSDYLKSLNGFRQNIKFTIKEIQEKEEKL